MKTGPVLNKCFVFLRRLCEYREETECLSNSSIGRDFPRFVDIERIVCICRIVRERENRRPQKRVLVLLCLVVVSLDLLESNRFRDLFEFSTHDDNVRAGRPLNLKKKKITKRKKKTFRRTRL